MFISLKIRVYSSKSCCKWCNEKRSPLCLGYIEIEDYATKLYGDYSKAL